MYKRLEQNVAQKQIAHERDGHRHPRAPRLFNAQKRDAQQNPENARVPQVRHKRKKRIARAGAQRLNPIQDANFKSVHCSLLRSLSTGFEYFFRAARGKQMHAAQLRRAAALGCEPFAC